MMKRDSDAFSFCQPQYVRVSDMRGPNLRIKNILHMRHLCVPVRYYNKPAGNFILSNLRFLQVWFDHSSNDSKLDKHHCY